MEVRRRLGLPKMMGQAMVSIDADFPAQRRTVATAPFSLSRADRRVLWAGLAVLLAVRLLAMFWLPFIDTTEARYAEIARKMVETGDWITPQFAYGVPFWGKPPLHTWLSALGMQAFGVGPFGARVFILACAGAVLGLIHTWVRRNAGADQALLAIVVLASSALFFGASAFVMTDMVMVLGTVLSMVAFHTALTGTGGRVFWGRMFFVGLAIGLLAKGPVATIITLIPLALWLPLAGRWRDLSALPWRSGLVITALLTLPWYIAAEIKTPGFLHYFLIGEHFQRFVVSGWQGDLYGSGHARPKGIIWLYAAAMFLPWTFFAATLLPRIHALRATLAADATGWHSYLALSMAAPLILFSPAANILPAYSLPAMPAAAVLLVSLWAGSRGAPGPWARRAALVSVAGVASLFVMLTLISHISPQILHLKTERDLVAAARQHDQGMAFTYWGNRSFSAEFYTAGKVVFTTDPGQIDALADNGIRDALVVSENDTAELAKLAASEFLPLGRFGRRILFIEEAGK